MRFCRNLDAGVSDAELRIADQTAKQTELPCLHCRNCRQSACSDGA